METNQIVSMKQVHWLGWLLVSIAGWTAGSVYASGGDVRSFSEIVGLFPPLIINGLLIGIISGVGQMVVLQRIYSRNEKKWLIATIIGGTLLAPVGLAIVTMIAWISFRLQGQPFLSEGVTMFFNPSPMYIVIGGFVLGWAQWIALRNILAERGAKICTLWVLGTWAGIGIGVFIGMFARGHLFNLSVLAQQVIGNAITGAIIGVVTGTILFIVTRGARSGNTSIAVQSSA